VERVQIFQETIKITVELEPSLMRFVSPKGETPHVFRSLLLQYLGDFVADLSIPANISLTIGLGEDRNRFAMTSYHLNIDENWCRLQIPSLVPQDVEAEELARSVAKGIYENPELFLSPSLAQKIQKQWSTENGKGFLTNIPLDIFHELLLKLVRHHFKITRAKELLPQAAGSILEQIVEPGKAAGEVELKPREVLVKCPYSGCSGLVRPKDKFCVTCRRPLMQCPICRSVMVKDIDFCSNCGYTQKRESAERTKQILRKWDVKSSFEECVSDWSVLKLKILLPNIGSLNSGEDEKAQQAKNDAEFKNMLEMMRDGLFYELGVIAPTVTLGVDNGLREGEFRLQLNDLRSPPIRGLKQGYFLVNDTVERLSLIKITGKPFVNPANESECAVARDEKPSREVCEEAGLTTWGPEEVIILALSATFRRNAAAFLTTETVKRSIDQLRDAFPSLIDTALEHYSISELTGILRDLLEEEFSIRDLRGILEALVKTQVLMRRQHFNLDAIDDQFKNRFDSCELPQFDRSKEVELLRTAFKRYISTKYAAYSNNLLTFLLDPEIERRILNSEKQPLKPGSEDYRMLIQAVFDNLGNVPLASMKAIILTSVEIRKRLKNLIEKEFPRLAVLCYQELERDLNIQPISRISLPRNLSGDIP
jgi:hypothetical protein